jgi:hypothetical protein
VLLYAAVWRLWCHCTIPRTLHALREGAVVITREETVFVFVFAFAFGDQFSAISFLNVPSSSSGINSATLGGKRWIWTVRQIHFDVNHASIYAVRFALCILSHVPAPFQSAPERD